ncbi:PH domain-containing protein [Acinetobacter harbinensis]|uniref:PH domain-containing protein n=1 Tax=Acinetobacter harbinensis TaxID=1353941 RepID=UPI001C4E9F95|nr:PH domain-containing protein [Acinetobacter harbinensis]
MFKNIAADLMGTSDIGRIIDAKDYDKTDIDDYIFHEDHEKIFFLIKAKTDEYCFTNTAFIHLDGTSAVSKKRTLHRYLYKHHLISKVLLETAGTVDRDVELKFHLGGVSYSIDIEKTQIDQVRDLYKALFSIGEACQEIARQTSTLIQTQQAVNNMFSLRELPEQVVLNLPDIICQTTLQVQENFTEQRKKIEIYDFSSIFERYLKQ